jgi:ribose/xylose/arabinose/galactoside ABC-type transport system permease subunit
MADDNPPAAEASDKASTDRPRPKQWGGLRRTLRSGSIFFVLAVLWIALALTTPHFFTEDNFRNIFLQSSTIGILALGVTIVLIAGEIDISIASVQALAGVVAASVVITHGLPFWVGIIAGIGVGCLVGLVNGYLTLFVGIPSFIATLAMLGIAQGIAFVMTDALTIYDFPGGYEYLGTARVGAVPVPVIIAAGAYLAAYLLLAKTRFGVEVYAVGGSRRAARLVGLHVERTIMTTFVISGFLAGLAGILLSARLDAAQGNFGSTDLLGAVAAVVIGGTSLFGGSGSVLGTAAGVLIISTIDNALVLRNVESFWTQIVVGGVIIFAVTLDRLAKGELSLKNLTLREGAT